MPKVKFKGKQSEGWKPLPAATYTFMIDELEEGVSSNGNPQLQIKSHVEGGPHDGKKATMWYSLVPQALWRLMDLLDATGVEYYIEELEEVDEESGKPMIELEFDTDDLPGSSFVCDAKQDTDNKNKLTNRFSNERPVAGSDAEKKLAERQAEEEAEESEAEEEEAEEEAEEAAAPEPEKAAAAAPARGGRAVRRSRTRAS